MLDILNDMVGALFGWKMCINCGKLVRDRMDHKTYCPRCGEKCESV